MRITQDLYVKAKTIMPGGTQLLSKRPEMFLPDYWPAYYEKAKGCEVWDLDGNKYTDMSYMGIGACIIGYADDDVDTAVRAAIGGGNMCTLNAPEEVALAELLTGLHPWAQMVRYARTGGEAMAMAVRIARAYSKKDVVLFCGYHGWHDWYLAANLAGEKSLDGHLLPGLDPNGVPRGLKGSSFPFFYNDSKGFLAMAESCMDKIGAIVLEPIRNQEPDQEFIFAIERTLDKLRVPLIVDEVSAGWRLNVGGAHLCYGIKPDIAVFAKGMSNGYPMAAVIGKREIMEAAQTTFISSTYWTDRLGPSAAIAAIKKMKDTNAPAHLIRTGKQVKEGWKSLSLKNDLEIEVSGMDPLGHFSFRYGNSLALKTLFTQLMLEKGFLATNAFYASLAHRQNHVEAYLNAVDEVFHVLSGKLKNGTVEKALKGPVCHEGFKRLT